MKYIDIHVTTNNILHGKPYYFNREEMAKSFMCIKPDITMSVICLLKAMGPDNSS